MRHGLEYILKLYDVQQKELADELGINKQNITLWIKEKQKISRKYLPVLAQRFDIPEKYFQKELTELDKNYIKRKKLNESVENGTVEGDNVVWDKNSQEYVTLKRKTCDSESLQSYQLLDVQEKEIKTIYKIRSIMNDMKETDPFGRYIEKYKDNIELFDRYADIVGAKRLNKRLICEVLKTLEWFEQEIEKKEQGSSLKEINEDVNKEMKRLTVEMTDVFMNIMAYDK